MPEPESELAAHVKVGVAALFVDELSAGALKLNAEGADESTLYGWDFTGSALFDRSFE